MENLAFNLFGLSWALEKAPVQPSAKVPRLRGGLKTQVVRSGEGTVVRLLGSAGMTEAPALHRELEALAAQKPPVLVVDMRNLSFIGSAGLAALLNARRRCLQNQCKLRLTSPGVDVLKVLERTGLTRLFPIYGSVQQAMAS